MCCGRVRVMRITGLPIAQLSRPTRWPQHPAGHGRTCLASAISMHHQAGHAACLAGPVDALHGFKACRATFTDNRSKTCGTHRIFHCLGKVALVVNTQHQQSVGQPARPWPIGAAMLARARFQLHPHKGASAVRAADQTLHQALGKAGGSGGVDARLRGNVMHAAQREAFGQIAVKLWRTQAPRFYRLFGGLKRTGNACRLKAFHAPFQLGNGALQGV